MQLQNGRPENTDGRLDKEIRVYDFLDKLGVIYDRVDHEALMTMEACEEADRVLEATICKNLFLCTANKKEFYLVMTQRSAKTFFCATARKQTSICS